MKLGATCEWLYKLIDTISKIINSQSFEKKIGYPANLPLELSYVHRYLKFEVSWVIFVSHLRTWEIAVN